MTTDKKTASNRKNAQKSTGPRSAEGRAVVSRNACKHGLLSRHLIIEGESQVEFTELLRLLSEEFKPVGLVEQALVERLGIALWRQRRLVRAEAADVSINQQRFGDPQKKEVGHVLNLHYDVYEAIKPPEGDQEETDIGDLKDERDRWKSLVVEEVADADDPFSLLPAEMKKTLIRSFRAEANQVDAVVKAKFGSWSKMFEIQVSHWEALIREQRIL